MPSTLSCKLPQYSCEPEYLDPLHCRPCFQYFPPGGEEEHLRESHDPPLTRAEYRRLVLRQTLSEWPQAIPPQVLRSRLAAFKSELCDANYAEKPCASCCRLKSPCKLFEVSFPSPATDKVPSWLPWSDEERLKHRDVWYSQVHEILNIDTYVEKFFHVSTRLVAAQREVLAFEEILRSIVPSAAHLLRNLG